MGGIGSGGHASVGRKPKQRAMKVLHGTASRAERAANVSNVGQGVDEFDAPDDLTMEERHVWLELAPHAFKARTLTRATSLAFRLLMRNIVMERALAADPETRAGANHRGILQRVETGLTAFGLRALGKPMVDEAPKAVDPFEAFEDGPVQ